MSLKEKVQKLQKQTPPPPKPKEDKWPARIREEVEKMDLTFWMAKMDEMCEERCIYKEDPKAMELWRQKKIALFKRDEIRYRGYQEILDNPNEKDRIMNRIKKQLEEEEKMLEAIERIQKDQQIKLDI